MGQACVETRLLCIAAHKVCSLLVRRLGRRKIQTESTEKGKTTRFTDVTFKYSIAAVLLTRLFEYVVGKTVPPLKPYGLGVGLFFAILVLYWLPFLEAPRKAKQFGRWTLLALLAAVFVVAVDIAFRHLF